MYLAQYPTPSAPQSISDTHLLTPLASLGPFQPFTLRLLHPSPALRRRSFPAPRNLLRTSLRKLKLRASRSFVLTYLTFPFSPLASSRRLTLPSASSLYQLLLSHSTSTPAAHAPISLPDAPN